MSGATIAQDLERVRWFETLMMKAMRPAVWAVCVAVAAAAVSVAAEAPETRTDPISRLQVLIDRAEVELRNDSKWGYLPSLLEALDIPRSSQVLVFSKTSAQFHFISPQSPRALYFNDDVYVGWVRGAPFLEISAADPGAGGIFYTLDQRPTERPRFSRDRGECLQCHESGRTLRIPGHLTRSVYAGPDGIPYYSLGTVDVDQTTNLSKRFGGWYVTGTVGEMTHRGNATASSAEVAAELDAGPESAVTDLSGYFEVSNYLTPHSDIVAHLVLTHQTQMHNHIALAKIEARKALDYRTEMIRLFGASSEQLDSSVRRRIESPSEKLVRHLLFFAEAPLEGSARGTTSFAREFQQQGRRDSKGRSLRDLDLTRRLFRYPCSYLIYSEAFADLPDEVKQYTYRRLRQILTSREGGDEFHHLSQGDRTAIAEILRDTLPEVAE